jgi:hypothetical protein
MESAARNPWADGDVWADLYEPSLAWADRYRPGLVDKHDLTATIHGIDGEVVVITHLDEERPAHIPVRKLSWGQALRHRLVFGWLGGVLLAFAAAGVFAAAAWDAPTTAGLAAVFGLIGLAAILSSSVHSIRR